MQPVRLMPLLLLLEISCGPGVSANGSNPVCRPPDDLSARTLRQLGGVAGSSDSVEPAYRDSVHIPRTAEDRVRLVADEAICRRALRAFNEYLRTPDAHRRVAVYQVGPRYLVEDPDYEPGGKYRGLPIFDNAWRYQATMLTF